MPDTHSPQDGARVRFPPPLVFLTSVLVGAGLQYGVSPLRIAVPRGTTLAGGALLMAAGIALMATAIGLFRASGQDPRPWTPSPSLVFRGPYRFSRNPIYVGMTLIQAGLGLALDDLWIVLLATASLLVVHFVAVRPEEAYLTEKFGDPYRQYLGKVRRYL